MILVDDLINDLFPLGSMYSIFTYMYHKNQPFMQVNIPVPWILWVWSMMVTFPLCTLPLLLAFVGALVLVKTTHSHIIFCQPGCLLMDAVLLTLCTATNDPALGAGSPWRSKSSNLFPVLLATYGGDVATSPQLS